MAIAPHDPLITALSQPGWRDFIELTKPRVSLLIVVAAMSESEYDFRVTELIVDGWM